VADIEVELLGRGRMNRVWRVGETVRRSRGPWSDTTATLLGHLEQRGFTAAPRYLGVDDQGRDILSVLPGDPVTGLDGDGHLEEVARLLRDLHAATADFIPPTDSRWRTSLSATEPTAGTGVQVIHRDVAPWNLLEVDGHLTGLVDWDLAGPGRPVEDLAYTAWHFVPLHGELMGDGTTGPASPDRPRRLRVLCDAYGLDSAARATFLGEVAGMQVRQAASVSVDAHHGDPAAQQLWNNGRFTEATARALAWLAAHRGRLQAALI
jgi:hypothetical protein